MHLFRRKQHGTFQGVQGNYQIQALVTDLGYGKHLICFSRVYTKKERELEKNLKIA